MSRFESELIEKLLKRNNLKSNTDEEYRKHSDYVLGVTEDEVQKQFSGFKASIAKGSVTTDSLRTAMFCLYVKLTRRRRHPGINDRAKKSLDQHIVDLLSLILFHLECCIADEKPVAGLSSKDVALVLFDMIAEGAATEENLTKFI